MYRDARLRILRVRRSFDEAVPRNIRPVPFDQYGDPGPGEVYDYWDDLTLNPPPGAASATIELLYQPTSWEYIQFLDLANTGQVAFLGDEGVKLRDAWLATGMAAPHVMATAAWVATTPACQDGLDNDGDGLRDYPRDPGCASRSGVVELESTLVPSLSPPGLLALAALVLAAGVWALRRRALRDGSRPV